MNSHRGLPIDHLKGPDEIHDRALDEFSQLLRQVLCHCLLIWWFPDNNIISGGANNEALYYASPASLNTVPVGEE